MMENYVCEFWCACLYTPIPHSMHVYTLCFFCKVKVWVFLLTNNASFLNIMESLSGMHTFLS